MSTQAKALLIELAEHFQRLADTVRNLAEMPEQPKQAVLNNGQPIYTEEEAAKLLGCSRKYLWKLRREGKIDYVRPVDSSRVFYSQKNLEDFARRHARGVNAPSRIQRRKAA